MTLPSTWTIRENQGKVTQYWKYDLAVEGIPR